MKNTATGNHAGPVGSITTSNRVPAAAPCSAAASTRAKSATVGSQRRRHTSRPSSASTRTVCALAIPRSIPTNRRSTLATSPCRRLTAPAGPRVRRRTRSATVPKAASAHLTTAPTHVLQTGPTSTGAGLLPSSGASVARPAGAISRTRPERSHRTARPSGPDRGRDDHLAAPRPGKLAAPHESTLNTGSTPCGTRGTGGGERHDDDPGQHPPAPRPRTRGHREP